MIYTTNEEIKRVNLDEHNDMGASPRPTPGNVYIDRTTMMVYFSAYDGKKIMKQPVNFDNNG